MPVLFGLRFDFRNPAFAGVDLADRYQAAIDMAEWADRLGCVAITVSEHHCSPDGYLPSPLPMLAAMAARTTNVRFMVAALIAPFYDPVRLAEDLLVLDNISRGRIDLIIGAGYVRDEFAMYGVPMSTRVDRVTETFELLRSAFGGSVRDRPVTPAPYRTGPSLMLGGSSEGAARRAAHIADGFMPSSPEIWEFYRSERISMGQPDPGGNPMGEGQRTVVVAEDPEAAWDRIGPYFLHETNAYGKWLTENPGSSGPYELVADVDDLRARGLYRILTPKEMVAELEAAPFPFVMFHPMCGGIPPELAWESLRLFESHVMPAFA